MARENLDSGFRAGLTPIGRFSHIKRLTACNFGFQTKTDCPIHEAKTKALISCAD